MQQKIGLLFNIRIKRYYMHFRSEFHMIKTIFTQKNKVIRK